MYAVHYWTASHAVGSPPYCLGHVVTKVSNSSTNASVVWTKQYKCTDGLLMGSDPGRIKLDIYGNLWLVYAVCSANGTASIPGVTTYGPYDFNVHFLRIAKNTGALLYHKSFKVTICDNGYQAKGIGKIIQDPYGNWYIGSDHVIGDATWNVNFNPSDPSDPANAFARTGWVIKLNYALDLQWGVRWTGRNGARNALTTFEDITYKNNSLYIATRTNQSPGTAPNFFKVDTNTGIFFAFSDRDYAEGFGYPALRATENCIATDSQENLYAALYNTWGFSTKFYLMKLNSTGTMLWTKEYGVDDIAPESYEFGISKITISASDRIFVSTARAILPPGSNARVWTYIFEMTTSGEVVSTRRYRNENIPSFNVLASLSTYTYSPSTLFLRFGGGDHVDTTIEVEEFNIPQRTMVSLPNLQPTLATPTFKISGSTKNTWGSIHSDFVAYPTSFTVTAPDRATQLFDAAKIRD